MTRAEPFLAKAGASLMRRRNLVFPVVTIGLLFLFPAVPVESSEALDIALHILGFALTAMGAALRAVTIGLVDGADHGGRARGVLPHRGSLFGHSRNPLYLGNLLIVAGLLVNHNNEWAYFLLGGFFIFAYAAIVTAEERLQFGRFGRDYFRYCLAVPRWGFRLGGLRETLRRSSFDWRRVVLAEYGLVALWTVMMLSDLAQDVVLEDGIEAGARVLAVLACTMALTVAGALRVRTLKFGGWLQ